MSSDRPYPAHRLFFPAASLLAAAVVAVQVAAHGGVAGAWRVAAVPFWHGHEMVFGFALAVVGGYLFTRVSRRQAILLLLAWLAVRVVYLVPGVPQLAVAAVATAFPIALFAFAGMPFIKAAKTWDNAMFGPIVAGFAAAELVFQAGALGMLRGGEALGLVVGIDVIALILFTMGGRIIAAATSGAVQRQGRRPIGAAQSSWERAGVLCLVGMAVADLFPALEPVAGALAAGLAVITMARLVKWRFWSVLRVREVAVLHLGYAWLGLGFAIKASAQLTGEPVLFDALHGIAVGALGTLSLAMMTRTTLQRRRAAIAMPPLPLICVAMISLAALLRLLAALPMLTLAAMPLAATFWTLAFLLFALWLLVQPGGAAGRSRLDSASGSPGLKEPGAGRRRWHQ